jgi:uncharacterized protein (DUF736 family)
MSGYEMKDMSGTLFRETEKKKETSPDFTGKVMVRGETLRIAGWLKQSKGGKAYISLAISEPRPAQQDDSAPATKAVGFDDIPF